MPLLDSDITLLDLSGTSISPTVVLSSVALLHRLQSLDLTHIILTASDWVVLGAACPLLQLLRLGGSHAADVGILAALERILPNAQQPHGVVAADTWEELAEGGS